MTIRDYQQADYDKLYEIDHAVFSKEIAYTHSEFRWYLRSRRCRTLVAEDAGEIVGFVTASVESRNAGHIITIDVAPRRQRQQIGSRLLEAIEAWLWEKGAEAVYLETAVDDSGARGFYERHGYFVFERRAGYYNDTLDAYLMMKTAKRSMA
ncbi:MAG TPA: GNAT family N-acetyltransferase [Blastocatellia bacterium]|nr:GNAT family N-acetyltransferase [Blastocatellia bacterium]